MSRRLPVYLVIDVSGSMSGDPLQAVENGLRTFHSAVRSDPNALETAYVSVIIFSDNATQVVPLTDVISFQPPKLSVQGGTSYGNALTKLDQCLKADLVKSSPEVRGDYRPLVFFFTDGAPTDATWRNALPLIKAHKFSAFVACGAGAGVNVATLRELTEDVVTLDTTDSAGILAFFKWVSASVNVSSVKVATQGEAEGGLNQLPPPPPVINLTKV
jgi:uncharacterized protein YegL